MKGISPLILKPTPHPKFTKSLIPHTYRTRSDLTSPATLHKFRHTYATRLLGSGSDIVTVQKLLGHSDIDTTRQYLNPDEDLKCRAVNRLSLKI